MDDQKNVFGKKIAEFQEKVGLGKDKTLGRMTLILVALGVVCILYVVISNINKMRERSTFGNLDCVRSTTLYRVDDDNMASLFHKGDSVSVFDNFYHCNEVKRNDLVLFRFSEQIAPVVRAVRGVPGDHYSVEKSKEDEKTWIIEINGKDIASNGKPFVIKSTSVPPLKTYEISRKGVLMPDEYIILSTDPPGLSDSTNLGLIHKNEFIGRVRSPK